MVITESVESDSGQYFCYAKNPHGMSPTKNVKVIVSEDNANGKSYHRGFFDPRFISLH